MGRRNRSPIWPYFAVAACGVVLAYIVAFAAILPPVEHKTSPHESSAANNTKPEPLRPVRTPETVLPEGSFTEVDTFSMPSAFENGPLPETVSSAPRRLVAIPNLVGISLDDARALLTSRQLAAVVRNDTSSWHAPNTILRQMPFAGDSVPINSSVTITASQFPPRR